MKVFLAFFLLAGVIACGPSALASPASPPLPLDSWIYPALDKLSSLGLIDSILKGSRPYSRLEAARLTAEGRHEAMSGAWPPVVEELLNRLEDELCDQLVELGEADGIASPSYLKPLRGVEARYLYQHGKPSIFPGTDARQFSLNTNNFGIDYDEHHNGELVIEGDARVSGFFLLHWRPLLLSGDEGDSFRLLEGAAAIALGSLEFSAGRQSLWWGQGRHGSLVLTNNAKPLDMVRLTNPSPILLPWLLRYLGPFRFDVFLSQLEDERAVPEPWFGGLRLNFKPFPWLELGASRTVMFGGEGRPDVGFDDFLTILGGNNLDPDEDTSNSVGAVDALVRIPALWGMELYGELGGEDEADLLGFIPFPSKKAILAGVYLPRLEPRGRVGLRLEYADLDYQENGSSWYRHHIYVSGYTYKERIMGHHVGGQARDYSAEVMTFIPGGVTLSLGYDYERRGIGQLVEEKHHQPSLRLDWQAHDQFTLSIRYTFDQVENFGFDPSAKDREFHLAAFGVRGYW